MSFLPFHPSLTLEMVTSGTAFRVIFTALFAGATFAGAEFRALSPAQSSGSEESGNDGNTFKVKHYGLELRINPSAKSIMGNLSMDAIVISKHLKTISLDMADDLKVLSVKSEGCSANFEHNKGRLVIHLPHSYEAKCPFTVIIAYHGFPTGSGFVFGEHGPVPMIYSYGLPFSAQQWFPCKDTPEDKAESADITITVPATLYAVSNGKLTGKKTNRDGTKTFQWKIHYPIYPDVISVAISNYSTFTLRYQYSPSESMPITFYVYPEDLEKAQRQFSVLPEMIKHHAAAFGAYPFLKEKYGVAEFAKRSFREHQTIPSFAADLVTGDHQNDWVLAHELAHQWFGDCISVKNWSDVWLNEGFANYAYALWTESTGGKSSYFELMRRWDKDEFEGSVFVKDVRNAAQLFSETTFQKGAWILHMLRHVLGDAAFSRALKSYVQTYAYKSASTEDFQRVCENEYGQPLDWFFKEWVYGRNRPTYQYSWLANRTGSVNTVRINIDQAQKDEQVFQMPLDVVIKSDKQEERFVAWQSARSQSFDFTVAGIPKAVEIDPEGWVLKNIKRAGLTEKGRGEEARTRPFPEGRIKCE